MKHKIKIFLIPLLFSLSSCYTLSVTTRGAVPVTTIDGELERTKTIHLFLGTKKIWDEDLCDGGGLAEVTVEPNFLQSLANVITIGIWKPVTVKYKCNETN